MGHRTGNVLYSEVLPKDPHLQPSAAASLMHRECGVFPCAALSLCEIRLCTKKRRILPAEQSVREGDGHLGCMSLGITSFINRVKTAFFTLLDFTAFSPVQTVPLLQFSGRQCLLQ